MKYSRFSGVTGRVDRVNARKGRLSCSWSIMSHFLCNRRMFIRALVKSSARFFPPSKDYLLFLKWSLTGVYDGFQTWKPLESIVIPRQWHSVVIFLGILRSATTGIERVRCEEQLSPSVWCNLNIKKRITRRVKLEEQEQCDSWQMVSRRPSGWKTASCPLTSVRSLFWLFMPIPLLMEDLN